MDLAKFIQDLSGFGSIGESCGWQRHRLSGICSYMQKSTPILECLKQLIAGTWPEDAKMPMLYPPAIARTLGFDLVDVDYGVAVVEIKTTPEKHGNPMGTIHGGVMGEIADAAIGTAHATTLSEGESFTSIDYRINFFRPVWNSTLRARAKAVQVGKTIGYYECQIVDEKSRLIAIVTSSVMTLRGDMATGR